MKNIGDKLSKQLNIKPHNSLYPKLNFELYTQLKSPLNRQLHNHFFNQLIIRLSKF